MVWLMLIVFGFLCYFAHKEEMELAIICAVINTFLAFVPS